jgi:uroporphyrinogen-III synthase
MGRRVIVPRSGADAAETAGRLAAMGFEPVVLPLTEFRRMTAIPLPNADAVDAVAITSANAIRLAPPELLEMLALKPCYAVARHTAEAASASGLNVVHVGSEGGAALGRSIAGQENPPRNVLFLCGRQRSNALETALQEAGIAVSALEIDDARPVVHTRDYVAAATQWRSVWAAMVYSTQTAQELRRLATASFYAFLFENARYVCISDRVAGTLGPMTGTVEVSREPSEPAMLELLATLR